MRHRSKGAQKSAQICAVYRSDIRPYQMMQDAATRQVCCFFLIHFSGPSSPPQICFPDFLRLAFNIIPPALPFRALISWHASRFHFISQIFPTASSFLLSVKALAQRGQRYCLLLPRTASAILRMCSGVVPQHPPIMLAPTSISGSIHFANSSGVSGKTALPSTITGNPAFA